MAQRHIGLTGGIGAGKTAAADILTEAGAWVVVADEVARELLSPGQPLLDEVVRNFSDRLADDVLLPDGSLNRPAVAAAIFSDPELRKELDDLVHPQVYLRMVELAERLPNDAVIFHDVPLLVETGSEGAFSAVLVVEAPEEVRVQRLIDYRNMTESDARARIAAQATDEQRRAVADWVVVNDGTKADLIAALHPIVEELNIAL